MSHSIVLSGELSGTLTIETTGSSYGRFKEKYLQTSSLDIVQHLNMFCVKHGFTPDWIRVHINENEDDGEYLFKMSKHPLLMLYWLMESQPDEHVRKHFYGAWKINMGVSCIALNIIVDTYIKDEKLKMNKFTMFYPSLPEKSNVAPLNCPSFRPSIFNGSHIAESRQMLENSVFPGMILNIEEDTIYPDPNLSSPEKTQVLCQYVEFLKNERPSWLHPSYTGKSNTALEEEYALMQTHVEGFESHQPDDLTPLTQQLGVSVVVDDYGRLSYVEAYPTRCRDIIQQVWKDVVDKHPQATAFSRLQDIPPHIFSTSHTTEHATPLNYHNAYVKFVQVAGSQQWCGLQCTRRGGLRMIFLIDVPETSTVYISPVNGESLPLPSFFPEKQSQHINWCWCDDIKVPQQGNRYMNEYRKVRPEKWIPYSKNNSKIIDNAFLHQASSCNITLGMVELTIHFRAGNLHSREAGVQCNKQRKHFIKRMVITDTEHKDACEFYNNALVDMQSNASGEKENCAICLESLQNNKCTLTPCGHLFHALCLQAHVNHTHHNKCPYCRKPMHNATPLQYSSSVHSGR